MGVGSVILVVTAALALARTFVIVGLIWLVLLVLAVAHGGRRSGSVCGEDETRVP